MKKKLLCILSVCLLTCTGCANSSSESVKDTEKAATTENVSVEEAMSKADTEVKETKYVKVSDTEIKSEDGLIDISFSYNFIPDKCTFSYEVVIKNNSDIDMETTYEPFLQIDTHTEQLEQTTNSVLAVTKINAKNSYTYTGSLTLNDNGWTTADISMDIGGKITNTDETIVYSDMDKCGGIAVKFER